VLAIERAHDGQRLLAAFNLTGRPTTWRPPEPAVATGPASDGVDTTARAVALPAWGYVFLHPAA
jgi:hypothetical protein